MEATPLCRWDRPAQSLSPCPRGDRETAQDADPFGWISLRSHAKRSPHTALAVSLKNLSSSVCSANHRFIAQKLLVQLPTELTLISLVALTSLGDRVGLGVGVRLLRLPLSLVPLVELVALALVSLVPLFSLSARSSMKILVSCADVHIPVSTRVRHVTITTGMSATRPGSEE